jgi:hypothetical protein
MRLKVILILLITALFLPYNTIAQEIVILHTNDVHSNVEPLSGGRNKGMVEPRDVRTIFRMLESEKIMFYYWMQETIIRALLILLCLKERWRLCCTMQ